MKLKEYYPYLVWVLGVLVGVLLVISIVLATVFTTKSLRSGTSSSKTISVTAEGKVKAVPDKAVVTAGVEVREVTAAAAQTQLTAKITAIADYLSKQGVDKKDISNTYYNVGPVQDYSSGSPKVTGYQANQTMSITIRGIEKDTAKLNELVRGLTDAGVNQIQSVNMEFEDPNDLVTQAKEQAIVKAKEKAAELARASGLRLGKVVSVTEGGSMGSPMPMSARMMDLSVESKGGAGNTAIEPGQQDVTASMTLIFELK